MKSILITGACGGMGRAAVKLFAQNGYRVFALDRIACDAADNVIPVTADVTSEESVSAAYASVCTHTEHLDAIVHFAGIYMLDSLVEMDSAAFARIFAVNVHGAFLINKTFLPMLRDGSRILITTSELAPLDPLPFTGIYAVTKAALDKYAYSLRMELQLRGITVSVLRAGAVNTGMLGTSTDALQSFCEKTQLYSCNAKRFRAIVDRVEARCIPTEVLAKKVLRITQKRRPAFAYSINRNPLLLMMNVLPKRLQLWAIRMILK